MLNSMNSKKILTIAVLLTAFCNMGAQGLPTDGKLTIRPLLQQLGEQLLEGRRAVS